jgi:hypothetical protein
MASLGDMRRNEALSQSGNHLRREAAGSNLDLVERDLRLDGDQPAAGIAGVKEADGPVLLARRDDRVQRTGHDVLHGLLQIHRASPRGHFTRRQVSPGSEWPPIRHQGRQGVTSES